MFQIVRKSVLIIAIVISLGCLQNKVYAAVCKKNFFTPIQMNDDWYKREEARMKMEDELIKKYSDKITKNIKPLVPEKYVCARGETCDPIKNCQMEENVDGINEVEYLMKIDSGIFISKSYCSVIGKCIGYNDFIHSSHVTASESRLIGIHKNNAVFYNYFYSAKSKDYEPPFTILSLKTGSEIYLNDVPNFSPDDKFMVEVRSSIRQENSQIPTGFNINIYALNDRGEYKKVEGDELDKFDQVASTFLSRNPQCGDTPYFHSWKNKREVRLSMLPPKYANHGRRVILSYDENENKWSCSEDLYPEFKCEFYLPGSTKFSSNLTEEQVGNCK